VSLYLSHTINKNKNKAKNKQKITILKFLKKNNKIKWKMQIKVVVTGPLEENCYIIFDEETNECIIIDPGDDGENIEEEIKRFSPEAKVKYILLTHAHFDHVGALKYVKEKLGGEILMHKGDLFLLQRAHDLAMLFGLKIPEQPPPDRFIEDSEEIIFNKIKVKAIHVPGHSPVEWHIYFLTRTNFTFSQEIYFCRLNRKNRSSGREL
jgi:hydroxyacylglutathione hydrolase